MIASGLMPRSPVWLRKIPSTVSGSQGSRRGFAPAVRFAFPLGARLDITLRARPCQELFSESFSRPSRGPRGAPHAGPTRGPRRFGSVQVHRRNRPGGPALARLGLPGHSIRPRTFNYLYISRRIGLAFRPGILPPSSCKLRFPYRWSFLIRLRQTSREANTSRDCFQQPRARRRVPSCSRP